ncbi:MAG: ABC transporter substrate-binding protein [Lachnospiraceae bacterium]
MKRKLLSLLLVATIGTGILAGCGSSASSDTGSDSGTSTESTAGASEIVSGETDKIIMTYLTLGTTPADLQMVQDAVNEISKEKINVEVELKAVPISDTFSGTYSMWIASGEQVDLMSVAFQGLSSYIDSGQLLALNEYLDADGNYIQTLADEFPLFEGSTVDGSIYGVTPVQPVYGNRGGLIMRKDYFEETGTELKDQYTWTELSDLLASVKANHSETYPYLILGSSISASLSSSGYFMPYDTLGGTVQSGVLTDTDSTQIVNLFETDEYLDFLKMMRDWNEKGYIIPDAATSDSLTQEILGSEKSSSYAMNLQPVQTSGTVASYGWESVALNTTEGYMSSTAPSSNIYWTVPVTSANPEAAVKFLNLIYEDQNVADLLKSGIEGTHYVVDETTGAISFPEGVTMENTTYFMPLGLYGDRRYELQTDASVNQETNDAWTESNKKNTYQSVGYSYNSANMSNQLIAIATVLNQYLPSLETGSVADVEGTYETMISALKAAGIDEVIADNQAQFDAWLAEQ